MEILVDPIIYFTSLLVCVCLGNFYKRIESAETKRNYGTGIGLLVACLVCGTNFLHTMFLVLGNTIIIICCHRSYVHRISFMYTWLFLLYFQFNVKRTIYELWIVQVITMRMVGLAFEVNLAYKLKFAKETSKPKDLTEMRMLVDPIREQSNTSIATVVAAVSGLKDKPENVHEKAGQDAPSDLKRTGSTKDLSRMNIHHNAGSQRNITASRSTNVRLSSGAVNQTAPPTAKKLSNVPAEAKNMSLGRGETITETKADKAFNKVAITIHDIDERRDSIPELQKNSKTISRIRLAATMLDSDVIHRDPSAVDIISYAYFFIGLHKGPYYRWKIFDDHFYNAFGVLGDCRIITERKLKKVLICSCIYMLLRIKYNPEIYYQSHFYELYNTDSRYLYSVPQLIMYFLNHQIVMLLCTAVCTETGFGVYPTKTQPVPGHGPTVSLGLLKLASTTAEVAMEQEYNFSMLKCFENEKLFLGPRMSDTMRAWNMPTRYWFRAYAYRNFMKSNKEVRSAFTFLCWTVWLSPTVQQFIVSITLWIYMHLEEEFQELYDTTGPLKLSWSMGFSIMRIMCLVYLTPCLVIEDTGAILRYYNSINWIYHIVLLVLILYAIIVSKFRATNVV